MNYSFIKLLFIILVTKNEFVSIDCIFFNIKLKFYEVDFYFSEYKIVFVVMLNNFEY